MRRGAVVHPCVFRPDRRGGLEKFRPGIGQLEISPQSEPSHCHCSPHPPTAATAPAPGHAAPLQEVQPTLAAYGTVPVESGRIVSGYELIRSSLAVPEHPFSVAATISAVGGWPTVVPPALVDEEPRAWKPADSTPPCGSCFFYFPAHPALRRGGLRRCGGRRRTQLAAIAGNSLSTPHPCRVWGDPRAAHLDAAAQARPGSGSTRPLPALLGAVRA
eukprot:308969-Rhodomonas_salina.1